MKIGILTFHNSYNFGANLQALAIQAAFEKTGASPVIINYQDQNKMKAYRATIEPSQAAEHEKFMQKYFNMSPKLTNFSAVEYYCMNNLDCIVVGSDQVFRLKPKYDFRNSIRKILGRINNPLHEPYHKDLPPYWLNWRNTHHNQGLIKAAISASAGSTKFYFLHHGLYKQIWNSIKNFDYVSVRDSWTYKMIKFLSLGSIIPHFCPDPVFCLNHNFKIPKDEYIEYDLSHTILLSVKCTPNWVRLFCKEAHKNGYKVASLPNPDREFLIDSVDFNIPLPLSPLQWYQLLANAAGYIGIRFHALVSCIANETPVITVESTPKFTFNYQNKSRLYDLCKRAGITDRFLSSTKKLNAMTPKKVLQKLFLKKSQENANHYAKSAIDRFEEVICEITKL